MIAVENKEYIERAALIKFMKKNTPNIKGDTTMRCVERTLKVAPAASDAIEVIRCGECVHLMFSDHVGECSRGHLGIVSPNDFCSRGERRHRHETNRTW